MKKIDKHNLVSFLFSHFVSFSNLMESVTAVTASFEAGLKIIINALWRFPLPLPPIVIVNSVRRRDYIFHPINHEQ